MKKLLPVTLLLVFLGRIAEAQTFNVVNPDVYQGGITIIELYPQFQTQAQGVPVCLSVKWGQSNSQEYTPNKHGQVFIGIKADTKPDRYPVLRVECGRGIQLDSGSEYINVVNGELPKPRKSSGQPRNSREKNMIEDAFKNGNNFESYTYGQLFIYPLQIIRIDNNRRVGDIFSSYDGISHLGVDLITLDLKTREHKRPVMAINNGRVAMVAMNFSLEGNMIIIDHGSGIFSVYMHLSRVEVKKGEFVRTGQIIARSGDSGKVSGPHLHFAVKVNDVYVDPLEFIETMNTQR